MVRDPYWLQVYLGIDAAEHRPRPVGDGATLAHGRSPVAAALPDGDRRHRGARATHSDPRRREPLVRRRAGSAQPIPPGNRLSGRGRAVLLPRAEQLGDHAARRHERRGRRELDRRRRQRRSHLCHERRVQPARHQPRAAGAARRAARPADGHADGDTLRRRRRARVGRRDRSCSSPSTRSCSSSA